MGARLVGDGEAVLHRQLRELPGADDDAGRTAAAYGPNFDRLRQVKAAYDPGNLLRVNRNVAPRP